MFEPVIAERRAITTRMVTTFLCCGWGYSFSYSFFRSLLVRPNLLVGMAAALPLGIVWAALERKRWGRLALLSLSVLAITLFFLMFFALLSSEHAAGQAGRLAVATCFMRTLELFTEAPTMSFVILCLAGLTAAWLLMPQVRFEFEKGKSKVVSMAQSVIALTLIAVWGVSMILNPPVLAVYHRSGIVKTGRSLTMRF